jgi:hypothetical protein
VTMLVLIYHSERPFWIFWRMSKVKGCALVTRRHAGQIPRPHMPALPGAPRFPYVPPGALPQMRFPPPPRPPTTGVESARGQAMLRHVAFNWRSMYGCGS